MIEELFRAAYEGNADQLTFLLYNLENPELSKSSLTIDQILELFPEDNTLDQDHLVEEGEEMQNVTLLHYAMMHNPEITNLLVNYYFFLDGNHNYVINTLHANNNTTLHLAIHYEYLDLAMWLIRTQNANIEAQNNSGLTPLYYAVTQENENLVQLLIDNGANVNHIALEPLIYIAADQGNISITTMLLNAGADVNAQDLNENEGNTALHTIAMSQPNIQMTLLLLNNGANPNAQNNDGETPLHHILASDTEYTQEWIEIVRLLLNAGTNLDIRDIYENTINDLILREDIQENAPLIALFNNHILNIHYDYVEMAGDHHHNPND